MRGADSASHTFFCLLYRTNLAPHTNALSTCELFLVREIPLSYDCRENHDSEPRGDEATAGKCDVTRRNTKTSLVPELELQNYQEAWNRHKKLADQMPTLVRQPRFIPLLGWLTSIGLIGVMAGPGVKTYKLSQSNADNVEQLANVTEIHSKILKDTTTFFDQFRNSVSALHNWAEEVEERLGDNPMASRLNSDSIYRGKKASLVKTYMQWFDDQEKILIDVNRAAIQKKIPVSLKNMLNGSSNFATLTNLSTLFECSYRLEDKNKNRVQITEIDGAQ